MVRITKDKRHDILKDGICIGQIYLARAESRKLRYWAISCMSGIGFNTFNEARSYAKDSFNKESHEKLDTTDAFVA